MVVRVRKVWRWLNRFRQAEAELAMEIGALQVAGLSGVLLLGGLQGRNSLLQLRCAPRLHVTPPHHKQGLALLCSGVPLP